MVLTARYSTSQRNFRSPHSSGLDSASQNSEDSYYGGVEESIQEWIPAESPPSDHPLRSGGELVTAAPGVEMSVLHAVKEGVHENASSDADDSSVPLMTSVGHTSESNTASNSLNNTTVRKRA
jgi:hypothetical protein